MAPPPIPVTTVLISPTAQAPETDAWWGRLLPRNRSHPPGSLPPAPWQGVDSSSTTVLVARGTWTVTP